MSVSLEVLKARSEFFKKVRQFFYDRNFLEIDTPILQKTVSMEPHIDPFEVKLHDGTRKGYLMPSPELALKQALTAGAKRIFEIAHSFRSGEKGGWHSSEFLMLEWYVVGQSYPEMMEQCVELIQWMVPEKVEPEYISVKDWFLKVVGCDYKRTSLEKVITERVGNVAKDMSYDELFFRCFLPTESYMAGISLLVLYDYPEECAAYAEKKSGVAKRFEVYLHGIECANAYLELKDPKILSQRIEVEKKIRQELKKPVFDENTTFIEALTNIEEEITGIALGLDRLFAISMKKNGLEEVSPYFSTL